MLAFVHQPGPHRHFIAVEDGVAVGRLSVNMRDEAGLYIWGVHVPEEHGRRGVCRRMLAALVEWLATAHPRPEGFVLSTNAFATHAHRAYRAVGFETTETRWHFDREIADGLGRATAEQRAIVNPHLRFNRGRWETRVHVMRRPLHWRAPASPQASIPARS
jgi:RimJ/RimL family protein N-acetyltransferase